MWHSQRNNYQWKKVRYLRCDNEVEKLVIYKNLADEKINNIKIEYTSPRTPQQNGMVERAFSIMYNKVRSMFNN